MKIKTEHYDHMRNAIAAIVSANAEAVAKHKAAHNTKRFRWDLFRAARLHTFASDTLYSYANDEHIDTALRHIVKELGL